MENKIPESELILNPDGSVYHLHLLPQDVAQTIIFVGDQDRVPHVSKHFDRIELKKHKREFVTHTGNIGPQRLTVISTGIGTDNIDIVLNELDALVNIDFSTKTIKPEHTALNIIRIGTSGALQEDIDVDSTLISSHGLGLDSLMHFYDYEENDEIAAMLTAIDEQLNLVFVNPYLFASSKQLSDKFGTHFTQGITATCCGFYAPQGRMLRADAKYTDLISRLSLVNANGKKITNFEMETAGIYGMAALLGHEAISVNAILANRVRHTFSRNPEAVVEKTIKKVLEILTC
jgi:uridine phosphorylase